MHVGQKIHFVNEGQAGFVKLAGNRNSECMAKSPISPYIQNIQNTLLVKIRKYVRFQ